jgi:hypothetical protein
VETVRNVGDNSLWQIVPDSQCRISKGTTRKCEFECPVVADFFPMTEAVETVRRVGSVRIGHVVSVQSRL